MYQPNCNEVDLKWFLGLAVWTSVQNTLLLAHAFMWCHAAQNFYGSDAFTLKNVLHATAINGFRHYKRHTLVP